MLHLLENHGAADWARIVDPGSLAGKATPVPSSTCPVGEPVSDSHRVSVPRGGCYRAQ